MQMEEEVSNLKSNMLDDHRGQEFARDATIWPQYAKEAESYDRGLVKEQRKSLDMILITAVAFCVVLGIFLLKSQDILQQDPANASLALLLLIAQSQHRIERGLPPLESESAPAIFGFAPPVTARWINGIWVTSFSLSLSAAMLAMLAKQWLINFLAARPLYGHDYARQRQSRLEGLDKWRALHIIAIIPSLLHISIILFATGLVIHLWILDIACAVALVVIVGITILFHFVTTVLGVAYEFCPFVTNISKYLRREDITFKDSTMLDIRAVLWLANHSRNSVVVDSSYQALAGLHRSTEANPNASATDNSSFVIPHHLDNGTTTISLLQTMMRRFERLATSSFHLSTFEETSLVRHLNSMLLLASHLRSSPHHASENQIHESGMKSDPNNVLAATKFRTGLPVSPLKLLQMVERVWVSETITLYGRTHMSLLVSAMEIMQIIVMDSHSPPSTSGHQAPKRSEFAEAHDGTLLSLDIHTSNELAEIHRHYGCWQACLAKIVSDYASKAGYVDTSLLEELLQALLISAKSTILNPYDLSATLNHRNDQVTDMSPLGYIRIENEDESHEWVEVNRELVLLDGLLRLTCSCMLSGAPFSESLVSAALTTYSALAPVSLHKVLKLDRRDLQNAFDLTKWSYTPSSGVSGLQYITVRQALLTIRYIALSGTTNELDFCIARNCLHVVNVCLSREGHSGSGSGAWLALSDYNADLMPLIELIGGKDFSIRFLSSRHMRQLVDLIVQSSSSVHIKPYKSVLSPACFPGLINLATWSGPEKLDEVLQAIIRDICVGTSNICETRFMDSRTPAIEYLRIFTLTKLGFSALLSVGDYPGNSKCITTAITRFTQLAANRDPQVTVDPVELGVLAVPGLLDAINAVVDDCSRSTERNQTLVEFADDVLVLLKVACSNDASKQLVVDHSALQKLWSTLLEMRDNDAAQTLASQLREIGVQIGVSFKKPRVAKFALGLEVRRPRRIRENVIPTRGVVSKRKWSSEEGSEQDRGFAVPSERNSPDEGMSKESLSIEDQSDRDSLDEDEGSVTLFDHDIPPLPSMRVFTVANAGRPRRRF